jgi:hypothetical protein
LIHRTRNCRNIRYHYKTAPSDQQTNGRIGVIIMDYDKLMKVLKKVGLLEHQDDYLDEIKIMIKEEMEKK